MSETTTSFVAPDFLALTIGIVVFFVGVLITQRVSFLRTYSIPEPVTGGFVADGGSNDIAATLMDDSGRAYYETDYTNKGKINVKVPRGHYTLVFSNRRAWFTDKSVAAEIYYQEQ